MHINIKKCFFHWREPDDELHGWNNINWRSVIELILIHFGAFCVIFVGVSKIAFCLFLITDILRVFCECTIASIFYPSMF